MLLAAMHLSHVFLFVGVCSMAFNFGDAPETESLVNGVASPMPKPLRRANGTGHYAGDKAH
jgi:hypothetical protein